jgi:hypothetical protein
VSYLGGGRWAIVWCSADESFRSALRAGKVCLFIDTLYLTSFQYGSRTLRTWY